MNQNDLTPADFDRMHEAAQKVFESLAKKIQARFPSLQVSVGRTSTARLPLYSHVTIEDEARPEIDPVVVGVDVRVDTGEVLIQAHMMGEETGKAYFDVPTKVLPFGTRSDVVVAEVAGASQCLADNTILVLERVFEYAKSLRTPA